MKKTALLLIGLSCALASTYSQGEQKISRETALSLIGGAEEVVNNSCCAEDPVCDTSDQSCNSHSKSVCQHEGPESWATHFANNTKKCNPTGTNSGKTCTKVTDSEYCGESYACTYSLILGKCINMGAAQPHVVPTTCTSSNGCP